MQTPAAGRILVAGRGAGKRLDGIRGGANEKRRLVEMHGFLPFSRRIDKRTRRTAPAHSMGIHAYYLR